MVQDVNSNKSQEELSIEHDNIFRYCQAILSYTGCAHFVKMAILETPGCGSAYCKGFGTQLLKEIQIAPLLLPLPEDIVLLLLA